MIERDRVTPFLVRVGAVAPAFVAYGPGPGPGFGSGSDSNAVPVVPLPVRSPAGAPVGGDTYRRCRWGYHTDSRPRARFTMFRGCDSRIRTHTFAADSRIRIAAVSRLIRGFAAVSRMDLAPWCKDGGSHVSRLCFVSRSCAPVNPCGIPVACRAVAVARTPVAVRSR